MTSEHICPVCQRPVTWTEGVYRVCGTDYHAACFEWPPCISFKWKTEIDVGAREKLLDALIEVLASKSKADWDPDCVSSLLVNLDLIRRNDDEPRIRNGAALAVSLLVIVSAIAISFLATVYPSRQASRLDPVQALRFE